MRNRFHFALLGGSVGYSKSPELFEAVYRHLKVHGQFDIHSVSSTGLESCLRELVLDGVRGFSITIPYKQQVIGFLDDIDPVARALGAVNSIAVHEGQLFGYNTDCYGFNLALQPYRSRLMGQAALLIGSGGAARAAAYALWKHLSIKRFFVYGRTEPNLQQFRNEMGVVMSGCRVDVMPEIPALCPDRRIRVIVNCTPLGGPNSPDQRPLPAGFDFANTAVYYDLNYNRPNTAVAMAREAGVKALDGAAMLVGQALRSLDIWTGVTVDFEPIYQSVFGSD